MICVFSGLFVQDPAFGDRGRLEKFVGNTYSPLLTKKPVKALIVFVFGIIFVSNLGLALLFRRLHLAGMIRSA